MPKLSEHVSIMTNMKTGTDVSPVIDAVTVITADTQISSNVYGGELKLVCLTLHSNEILRSSNILQRARTDC